MAQTTYCIGCGDPVTEEVCQKCQTPNIYQGLEPLEYARKRLARRAKGTLYDSKLETFPVSPGGASGGSAAGEEWEAADTADLTARIVSREEDEEEGDDSTVRIDATYPAKLIRLEPEGEPAEIRLASGTYVVGRPARRSKAGGPSADILIHHKSVSRRHAEITCTTDENGDPLVSVCDLGSANGTIVNNRPVAGEPVELSWDDEIVFGEVRYRLRIQRPL